MTPIIVANWKCNPLTQKQAKQLFTSTKNALKNAKNIKVIICPPFIYLSVLQSYLGKSNIQLGGQDCFWENQGAFTGEVSGLMLKNLGCQYVILGHSERRIYFKEDDEIINKKIKSSLKIGFKPILCVGDSLKNKNQGERKFQEIEIQLKKGLENIKKISLNDIIIAYEPVWAISAFDGKPAIPDDAMRGILFIRKILSKIFTVEIAKKVKILYGGSVMAQNASKFIYQAQAQGLLVGSASLDKKEFIEIVKAVEPL